ncbi:hypothetical protein BABINDRAFT_39008 [Babjeviella inositovora NRRL Y-12698]|uniref:Serine/threonine-protein phosphatase n=1 Tax=Babjeviella inositovora NRRL Y-12698 TaxID=984486 RepID=A0A1E3QMC3_9ASCO|nr:uncharacterized protein BABINDRAFT_39008 [Babjeviella inositovora NRRL Y-12698]ODQ78835.1 hypothetical protein BABINDRAFT_39008 [Babjeviella inositovora NRRL Y-12698]
MSDQSEPLRRSATQNTKKINAALRALKNKKPATAERNFSVHVTEDGEKFDTTRRIVDNVPPPAMNKPEDSELFLSSGLPNYHFLQLHFLREGRLHEHQVVKILQQATALLSLEPNLLTVPAPVTVCGDVHGQFYDLVKLFEVGGDPSITSYLFLGDYVDRGSFSIECVLLLYAMKLNHPTTFWMLRGNHECKHLTDYFTFKSECLHKYSEGVYNASLESFNALPLAAVMNKQFFCVHGGLSPELKTPLDVNKINRFREPPTRGLMCDLLWADPITEYDEQESSPKPFVANTVRGCSFAFTYTATCSFLERNGLLCVIRAHEAQDAGYRMYKRTKTMGFPSLLTMFSAPNYLDLYNNKAAILKYDGEVMNIRQFNASPHPYWLPNFMDVFTWSLPFVGEKVTDMLVSILNICTDEELDEDTELTDRPEAFDDVSSVDSRRNSAGSIATSASAIAASTALPGVPEVIQEDSIEAKRRALRNKILAIGRVSRMYQVLQSEQVSVNRLKDLNGGNMPKGSLLHGSDGLKDAISFEEARRADLENEKLPPSMEEQQQRKEEIEQELAHGGVGEQNPVIQRLFRRLSQS